MAYAGALVPYLVLIDDVAQAAEFARACSDDGAEDTTGADRSDAELIAPFFVSHVANIYANLKVARDRASDNVRTQPHTAIHSSLVPSFSASVLRVLAVDHSVDAR
jgi:hypothetical protein